jgi:soluble lytic murein transglycosylase-like protein
MAVKRAAGSTAQRRRVAPESPVRTATPGSRFRWRVWLFVAIESAALLFAAFIAVVAALSRLAAWFAGATLWSNLLPFAAAVLGLGLLTGLFSWAWLWSRRRVSENAPLVPLSVAIGAAGVAIWFAASPTFQQELSRLRLLMGGAAEASRVAVAHQVYAAYRRSDLKEMKVILERGRVYEATVHEAASVFGVDAEILMGIAATESAFNPRNSKDGGRGLFQITSPPASAVEAARGVLRVSKLDRWNQRHNAFLAAATLRRYLRDMRGDLFLALLAYNIGPKNGGLLSIMEQYGARDFVSIQPYLKNLPRDYPVRVLAAALAYRLWCADGRLPRYEEGDNAVSIQNAGIPGFRGLRVREAQPRS